jgi:NADPH:quinone reductase-like Zn-dependent oxidoreductase
LASIVARVKAWPMRAVRFEEFGDEDVLQIAEVPRPRHGDTDVVVEVVRAGINPGEAAIRKGLLESRWPTTLPCGQGSDFAGRVVAVGDAVQGSLVPGDEVVGWVDTRSSHADFVVTPADQVVPKPPEVDWEQAGGLFVAGATAFAAVRAVELKPGETVAVSGAAGGVGSIAVQLARRAGANVLGIASDHNGEWLRSLGAVQIPYGDGLEERLRQAAPDGIHAFLDLRGGGYVALALELGIARDRIDTIADFEAIERDGVKGEGSLAGSSADVLGALVDLIATGGLSVPIAAVYRLEKVREAYRDLARGHTHGKIVLAVNEP